jgi:hypothetical protein
MAFIRYKQRGGKWYAYEVLAFWDPTSKKPKQKTTYLGVASSKGGEITNQLRLLYHLKKVSLISVIAML